MAWVWIVLALIILGAEILTGTVFLLFVSGAMLLPGVILLFEPDLAFSTQLIIFSLAAAAGLAVYKYSRKRKRFREDNSLNSLDVGNWVEVRESGNRANYRGSSWDVQLKDEPGPLPAGRYRIVEVKGTVLIVIKPDATSMSSES